MSRALVLAIGFLLLATSNCWAATTTQLPAGTQVFKNVQYGVASGKSLLLDLYLPGTTNTPPPLVVWVHGGSWAAGSKDDTRATFLVGEGYAVASIDYRLTDVAPFPAQLIDCKTAIRWLRAHAAQYGYNAERIGVWGSSAGGHLVAMLGTTGDQTQYDVGENLSYSSRVQAVCDYYGHTDLVTMVTTPGYTHKQKANTFEAKFLGGPVLERKEQSALASPLTYITKDDPPFIIFHGTKDPTVPPGQSQMLYDALVKAGVEATLHYIPDGVHGGTPFFNENALGLVTAFFNEHLL